MAKLIVVCGPQAVGKMTVAESLRDKLRYNMMINHDSIEVSDRIFGFDTPAQREFNRYFREEVFDLAVKHDVNLIFTYVAFFDDPEEIAYLRALESKFRGAGGEFFFAELSADLDTRLSRNETPHRLERKASKRDLAWSRANLLGDTRKHMLNTPDGVTLFEHHMKADNTHLTPDETADLIISSFSLTPSDKPEREYRYGI